MVRNFKFDGDQLKLANSGNERLSANQNGKIRYINFGEDDQMEIQGFTFSKLKNAICWIFYILTLGILRLAFHWHTKMYLYARHSECDLAKADTVLITDCYTGKFQTHFVKKIQTLSSGSTEKSLKFRLANGIIKETFSVRLVKCKKLTYIWDENKGTFMKLCGFENSVTNSDLHDFFPGQSKEEQLRKRMVYGNNEIITPVTTILALLALEALTPFYMFQLFSLILWSAQAYIYYAVAILVMSVVGISTSIIQTRKNQRKLKGTVCFTSTVTVKRGEGLYDEVPSLDLVPGDVIVIPKQGCEMYCDAVLLTGSCIVNESMLTGESVPVTKTPIENNSHMYNIKEDSNHTLFGGTRIIQIRTQGKEQVTAVVIRTGFLTTKGELVRSILYPPPADFKFERDSYKYIGILTIIAAVAFVYTVVSKASRQVSPLDIAMKALDIITIVIPPALPAAMTVGKLYAIHRLKNHKIFCINSRVINVTGSVDCICFDKTGTLTEDALDMWGVVSVENQRLAQPVKDLSTLSTCSELFRGMTVCHSLTVIDGEIGGDPLDLKMFESTGWKFEDRSHLMFDEESSSPSIIVRSLEKDENNTLDELGIVKQFQFSSSLQRMSVIVKSPNNSHFELFCKGSPEKVVSLSDPATVPHDLYEQLKVYTQKGYRVIGLAKKNLSEDFGEVSQITRDEAEIGMEFLGLIILENCLKPQTKGVIQILKDAKLKIIMITGDNIETAVTVAKECKIIDPDCTVLEVLTTKPTKDEFASINYNISSKPNKAIMTASTKTHSRDIESVADQDRKYCFVITGDSWANVVKYFPDLIPKIVTKGVVFARMTGAQKQQLIEQLKLLGYYVAMCGDGANDCGALKAAHVGISLSEAESSVASPFTSQEPNISCIPKVIKEGRAALVTSFGVFKVMICYSLTEFASVIILYAIDTNLSSMQFLYIDIPLILHFAVSFGKTSAYDKLATSPPRTSLLSFIPLTSLTIFLIVASIFQKFAYEYIQTFDWFTPFEYIPGDAITRFSKSYENYAVFSVSMFQYIIMVIVFSEGKPYRKPIYSNFILMMSIIVMTGLSCFIAVYSGYFTETFMELKVPPALDGKFMVLGLAAINYVVAHGMEDLFVNQFLGKWLYPKIKRRYKSKKQYLEVMNLLKTDDSWMQSNGESRVNGVDEIRNGGHDNNGFINSETDLNSKL